MFPVPVTDFCERFCMITASLRRMREGNVYSLFTREGRGGIPHQARATPSTSLPPPPSKDRGTLPPLGLPEQRYPLPSLPKTGAPSLSSLPHPQPGQGQDGCVEWVLCLWRSRRRTVLFTDPVSGPCIYSRTVCTNIHELRISIIS